MVFVEGLSLFLVPPYCFTRQDAVESLSTRQLLCPTIFDLILRFKVIETFTKCRPTATIQLKTSSYCHSFCRPMCFEFLSDPKCRTNAGKKQLLLWKKWKPRLYYHWLLGVVNWGNKTTSQSSTLEKKWYQFPCQRRYFHFCLWNSWVSLWFWILGLTVGGKVVDTLQNHQWWTNGRVEISKCRRFIVLTPNFHGDFTSLAGDCCPHTF